MWIPGRKKHPRRQLRLVEIQTNKIHWWMEWMEKMNGNKGDLILRLWAMKSLTMKLQFSPCSKTPGGGGTGQCGPRKQNGIKWCGGNRGEGGGGGRSVQHHPGRHLRHCGWKLYLQPSHPEPPSCSASQTAAWLWTRDADDLQRSYTLFFSLFYSFFLITFFLQNAQ